MAARRGRQTRRTQSHIPHGTSDAIDRVISGWRSQVRIQYSNNSRDPTPENAKCFSRGLPGELASCVFGSDVSCIAFNSQMTIRRAASNLKPSGLHIVSGSKRPVVRKLWMEARESPPLRSARPVVDRAESVGIRIQKMAMAFRRITPPKVFHDGGETERLSLVPGCAKTSSARAARLLPHRPENQFDVPKRFILADTCAPPFSTPAMRAGFLLG